jgi:glycine/D-amino acid oxidase-like deaminating enzyme
MTAFDVIIVGQGLAGTTLALHLMTAGRRVLVLDAGKPVTASKIAAGLMTPVTGQRLTLSWRVDEFLPYARAFYARIEQETGQIFCHDRMAVRLFSKEAERAVFENRQADSQFRAHLADAAVDAILPGHVADTVLGGFCMNAAQLDVAAFLAAARGLLTVEEATVDWEQDVAFDADSVTVLGHSAKYVVSCEGFSAALNPYFGFVPFNAAKGDILTLRFKSPVPACSLHRGIWLAPTSDPLVFRLGASYDWAQLDQIPDTAAGAVLEEKLRAFFHVPYEIISHEAAVRPIVRESKALIGFHPAHPQLGYFNALGSKGSLHGPWFARLFSKCLMTGAPVPAEFDVQQYVTAGDPV